MVFVLRPEWQEGASQREIWTKSFPGGGKSVGFRSCNKVDVASGQRARER